MELYHFIYTSNPARRMTDTAMQNLLEVSREANTRFEVTGLLVCLTDCYIQLIEGPKTHVEQLYQNIQRDQRHLRVTKLCEGALTSRYYPGWAMAYQKQAIASGDRCSLSFADEQVLQLFEIIDNSSSRQLSV